MSVRGVDMNAHSVDGSIGRKGCELACEFRLAVLLSVVAGLAVGLDAAALVVPVVVRALVREVRACKLHFTSQGS